MASEPERNGSRARLGSGQSRVLGWSAIIWYYHPSLPARSTMHVALGLAVTAVLFPGNANAGSRDELHRVRSLGR